jgi:hypothetical protein
VSDKGVTGFRLILCLGFRIFSFFPSLILSIFFCHHVVSPVITIQLLKFLLHNNFTENGDIGDTGVLFFMEVYCAVFERNVLLQVQA